MKLAPHRFPRPKPRAPQTEHVNNSIHCHEIVQQKLGREAMANGALSPPERMACGQAAEEAKLLVEQERQRVQLVRERVLPSRSEDEKKALRDRAAEAALRRMTGNSSDTNSSSKH